MKNDDEIICKVPSIGDILQNNQNISDITFKAYSKGKTRGAYLHYIEIYGAYVLNTDWEGLEYRMENLKGRYFYKPYTRDAVFNGLKYYAKGFQYGFDNFMIDNITTRNSLSDSEATKCQKVMDFLSRHFSCAGFPGSTGQDAFKGWHDYGIKAGYEYAAWYLVFENHRLFEPYFLNEATHKGNITKTPFDVIATKNEQPKTVLADMTNNFDSVEILGVYKHFKNALVDKKYLSDEELINYISAAFDKKEPPKDLFKFTGIKTKQGIYEIFYDYYKDIAGKPHRKSKQYAKLLGEYFEGYKTENIVTNWNH